MHTKALVHDARVSDEKGDIATGDDKVLEAAAEARVALGALYHHPLWDQLREEQQRRLEEWDLKLPFVGDLFVLLAMSRFRSLGPHRPQQ